MIELVHAKVRLALHERRGGDGLALLLLHPLGERSPASVPEDVAAWPGPVYALDFTGHGDSTLPAGGGYTAELLMADADAALERLGAATLVGRGLGGYVATLLCGARPKQVRGVVVCDGTGLCGGGAEPGPSRPPSRAEPAQKTPDPFAIAELSRDLRPPDYVAQIAHQAAELSGLRVAISVAAGERPPWLAALLGAPGVAERSVQDALADYA